MSNLIKIGNQEIAVKEYQGQRVVTLKDIDTVHERAEGTADRNFREHKDKLISGEDYFFIIKSQNNEIRGLEVPNRGATVITEQGYLMLVKSLQDDLAWEVQRKLVKSYFNNQYKPLTALEQLNLHNQAILEVNEKVEDVKQELEDLKNDMPVLALDLERIKIARNHRIVPFLGGKRSKAYKDKSLTRRVYSDNATQVWREYGIKSFKELKRSQVDNAIELINNYELPFVLAEEIKNANAQINLI